MTARIMLSVDRNDGTGWRTSIPVRPVPSRCADLDSGAA